MTYVADVETGAVADDDDTNIAFDDNIGVAVANDVNAADVVNVETATDADDDDTDVCFDDNVGVAVVNDGIPVDSDVPVVEFTISKVPDISTRFSNTATGLFVILVAIYLQSIYVIIIEIAKFVLT